MTAGANPNQVLYLAQAAESIRDEALASAREKLAAPERDLPLDKLWECADFLDYFKYGLATRVAAVLVASDPRIQAIYLYDPSGNPGGEARPGDVTVHQLVRVGRSSAALEAFVASLDRALLASLQQVSAPVFAARKFILDTCLISDEDAELGRGYAALLNSVFAPPLMVWERKA